MAGTRHYLMFISTLLTLLVLKDIQAINMIKRLEGDVTEAKDNLELTKLSQTLQANKYCADNYHLIAGDCVLLLCAVWNLTFTSLMDFGFV
jgi:hypothetical protein